MCSRCRSGARIAARTLAALGMAVLLASISCRREERSFGARSAAEARPAVREVSLQPGPPAPEPQVHGKY